MLPARKRWAALGIGAAAAGALWWSSRRSTQALLADPEREFFANPPRGRALPVRSADGTGLHAEVFGPEDAPTIVLIHGWTASLDMWAYQLRDLADRWRLVAYDLRGHARSERGVDGDYSAEALAADLDAVLQQCVPENQRVVLVGHSMGGMGILAWAREHPERVRERIAGAALLNTGADKLLRDSLVIRGAALLPGVAERVGGLALQAALPLQPFPSAVLGPAVRYVAMHPGAGAAEVGFMQRLTLACPTDVRAAFGTTLAGLDLADAVAKLTCPTLVFAGELDKLTPPVHSRRLADQLPDGKLIEIPGIGHIAPVSAHEEVTNQLHDLAVRTLV